ncbi:MAG: extradiol dioxygenase family protein [Flavobacteriales bacterium]|jgi:extradiol dioxygenase family protein
MKPFHLSFVVPNLDDTKEFYTQVLGCTIGRDTGTWIDILFFVHQITIHQATLNMKAKAIDHFGPILEKETWLSTSERCKSKGVEFVMQPTLKNEGTNEESGKFIILDPAKNIVEFRFYNSFEKTMSHI